MKHAPSIHPSNLYTWSVAQNFHTAPFFFLIHRKYPFLIKFPKHLNKSYYHTVNKLACPKPGLTQHQTLEHLLKPLYLFLKHLIPGNKVLEKPWVHLTFLKDNLRQLQILYPFPRITSTPKKQEPYSS